MDEVNCPVAEEMSMDSFMLTHPMLLGNEKETTLIVEAIKKLKKHADEL